jgi:hypothetical protein
MTTDALFRQPLEQFARIVVSERINVGFRSSDAHLFRVAGAPSQGTQWLKLGNYVAVAE